jgi:hypothetical protein
MKQFLRRLLRPAARFGKAAVHRAIADELPLISKTAQHALFAQYRMAALRGDPLPSVWDVGFRVFSQTDEDGILLFLFGVIGTQTRTFVDIGSGTGIEWNNCANLAVNFGWHGLFIDGNPDAVEQGKSYYAAHPDTRYCPPQFICARITRENVNAVIQEAGFTGEVDLLSIDIDGNDYWVWEAISCIDPRVVVIETHVEFGMRSIVVPYDANYVYPGIDPQYHGASPAAMAKLASRQGYRLVAANRFGWNTFYLRNDLGVGVIPEIPVESVLQHAYNRTRAGIFDTIRHLPYVEVE